MDKVKIKLHENQKIFFTSDLHFQHKNVIRFCKRPFENTKDMELKLIENWNSVVSNEDIVFDLGDVLWFDGRHDAKRILNQLNGIHYVILGNHDNKKNFELCDKVIWLHDGLIKDEGKPEEIMEKYESFMRQD